MHASRLAVLFLAFMFAASTLFIIEPADSAPPPVSPPDFSIQVIKITYNVTSINGTAPSGNSTITHYDKAELKITFSTSKAAEYVNNGYYIYYDLRYKDHSEPEILAHWHTIFDENDYPEQIGSYRGTTVNCSVTYPSNVPNLDFQARTITARPFIHWYFERVDNKWVRVNETFIQGVGSSEWSSNQMLTGLSGLVPVTPAPSTSSNQPTPIPFAPEPTGSTSPRTLDGIVPGWVESAIMALVGITGGIIVLWGIFSLRRNKSKAPDAT